MMHKNNLNDDVVLVRPLDGATDYHRAQELAATVLHSLASANVPVFTYVPDAELGETAASWCRARLVTHRSGHGSDALLVEDAVWGGGQRGFALALITGRDRARQLIGADAAWWSPLPLDRADGISGRAADPAELDVLRLLTSAPDERTALCDEHGSVTYGALREGAFAVARSLRDEHGVRPGDRIALLGGRDTATAAHLIGAWLAGAAWCALDRELPLTRREAILGALSPRAVVDTAGAPVGSGAEAPPRTVVPAEEVAYFVATSGSTGTPKLSALTAGGLRPLLDAWTAYYGLDEPNTVLQIGSWEGDVFLGDLLKALGSGGTLIICPKSRRADPEFLACTIVERDVSFVETTPALMRAVMRALEKRACGLRVAVVGSDAFRMQEARELVRLMPEGARLVNGYGLTECTVESLVYDCAALDEAPDLDDGLCPLGAPLPGTRVRVVDPGTGMVVPREAVGELVIESPGVGLGYLGAHGIATEGGFGGDGFRTGDLVALDEDGLMHFHGRSDSRVKVRGHRVELGDVENALLRIPGVAEAYVCPFERAGVTELAAFVGSQTTLTDEFVRSELLGLIPAAVVPVRFHFGEELPRLHNGKLDRRAMIMQNQRTENVAGENVTDILGSLPEKVRHCWESVLGRPVDPGSTFFDQGGTSLLVITLAEVLHETLGSEHAFAVADLFRHPTVDAFAAALQERAEPRRTSGPSRSAGRRQMLQALAQGNSSVEEVLERIRIS